MISVSNLSFEYDNYIKGSIQVKKALDKVNIEVKKGEIFLIMGPSGCGKTTLLRSLKEESRPQGRLTGEIKIDAESKKVAIVFSHPDTQLVTSTVLSDLALPMENLALDNDIQKKRMSETVSYFGIDDLLQRHPDTLSGGQKQLVALSSQLMLYPDILLLDEPISQLDPIAAMEFTDVLRRLNEELGITLVITEHKPDYLISMVDKIAYMQDGQVIFQGPSRKVLRDLWEKSFEDEKRKDFIPVISKASLAISPKSEVSINPKELKLLAQDMTMKDFLEKEKEESKDKKERVVAIKELFFAYTKGNYALRNLDLEVEKGEFLCLMGSNGSGKSTLLKVISGMNKGQFGKVKTSYKKIQYMPQDLMAFFRQDTVEDELYFEGMDEKLYEDFLIRLNLKDLLDKHPYDLSSGEQQKVVLATMLLRKPDLIILDEPTKSMDPFLKKIAAQVLLESKATIICATHDLEFAADYASRCIMLFNGEVAYSMNARDFFKQNRYYTTSINKALRELNDNLITYGDIEEALGGKNEG